MTAAPHIGANNGEDRGTVMQNPLHEGFAFEVHHTVITVIEGVGSADEAEALARRLLERGPVERLSITEGADVFRVEVEPVPVAGTGKRDW